MMLLAQLLDELPEDALPAGLHARLLERAPRRLLRAPGVPRRQRAGAGGDRPPLSPPRGRALRGRAADEDPRPGGLGAGLPGGRRTAGLPELLRAAAPPERRGERGGAARDRARAGLGARGGDRRLLPARRLRAHGRGGRRGLRSRRSTRRSSNPSTSSRRCRSGSRAAARRSSTRSPPSRARRTTAPSRSPRASAGRRSAAAAAAARSSPSRSAARRGASSG